MKRIALCMLVFLLLFLTVPAAFAAQDERDLVSTEDWTPPDLSGLSASDAPELLLLQVAQGELGYTEGPLTDETKYGEWFSGGRVAWCAEFVTWCVDQVDQRYGKGLLNQLYPYYGGPSTGVPFFIEKGRFVSDTGSLSTHEKQWLVGYERYLGNNEYIPYPGDYIWFYYYNRNVGTDHVALVEGVSLDADGVVRVHVIEGNNPDKVQRAEYLLTDWRIYGFGTPVKRAYTNLRIYNSGDDVTALQADLETLGYYEAETGREGVFTTAVQTAVKKLQKAAGITADGIVDMDTRNAMNDMLSAADAS